MSKNKMFDVIQKHKNQGFPCGPVVKNSPATAGDTGFDPWSGKMAHATEQLSPRVTTTEARTPRDCVPQQGKPWQGEALAPQQRIALARCNKRKPTCSNEDPA